MMNSPPTLVEYGSPIDAQSMVTPPDATELELEPGEPVKQPGFLDNMRDALLALRSQPSEAPPGAHAAQKSSGSSR